MMKNVKNYLIQRAILNNISRNVIIRKIRKLMWRNLVVKNPGKFPHQVQMDKIDLGRALFHTLHRNINRKLISKAWLKKFVRVHLNNLNYQAEKIKEARTRLGFTPPLFITISPGKSCNLKCLGCYASSSSSTQDKLQWEVFDRILTEKRELWGSYFTVISGGEPFIWKDRGKTLFDILEKHDKQFFLIYTNGTLIDKTTAGRLKELGNATPAISVEGYEEETDKRRGRGTYRRIMEAVENLRKSGVPFGVSITAMKQNWDLVSDPKFVDYWFNKNGATYGWIFQYMPIGDRSSFDMVIEPHQRLEMLKRLWETIREQEVFIADFWNSGTATSGCIAGGRPGGYFHINWSGNVTPCVFVPYSDGNINDIYADGGNLEDAITSPFMERVRKWQAQYGFTLNDACTAGKPDQNCLAPCFFRDHYPVFLKAARECCIQPVDQGAETSLHSGEYQQKMIEYGKYFGELSGKYWQEHYLK